MPKLVLIRHGESTWNLENRFTGWTDVPLTETGVQQAREAGRLLAAVSDRTGGRRLKEDGSPTTAADLASEALILERLRSVWPHTL